jgi:hypothetical protein
MVAPAVHMTGQSVRCPLKSVCVHGLSGLLVQDAGWGKCHLDLVEVFEA